MDINDNVIRKLKSSEIQDRSYISNYSLYEDDFIKEFTLKHNRYPYKITYTYKQVFKDYVNIAKWSPIHDPKTKIIKASLSSL